jgi:6-pyruvoyltetrahydropterin/6-carboxytetrahydropterin synthase
MGIDFKLIKKATKDVARRLDHHYLNDIKPFNEINPTAENLAAYFYRELTQLLNGPHVSISAVTMWETERACVRYSEET